MLIPGKTIQSIEATFLVDYREYFHYMLHYQRSKNTKKWHGNGNCDDNLNNNEETREENMINKMPWAFFFHCQDIEVSPIDVFAA